MRRFAVVGVLVAGCGGAPESVPEATLKPVDPSIQASVEAPFRAAEPPPGADVGPGGLPAAVVEAAETLFPKARRIRCPVPDGLPAEGLLGAVWLGPREEALRGPVIRDGWLAAAAPTPEGRGLLLRDGRAVAELSWRDAAGGAWAECTVSPLRTFQILGLVETPDGLPIAGATVRGCQPGDVVTTNEQGRFVLEGVAGRACPVFAVIRDAEGFGKSETHHLASEARDGVVPDAIVELTVPPERLAWDAVPAQAARFHGVLERQLRNGLGAELDGFREAVRNATLSPEARAVAEGWLADLAARVALDTVVVEGLARGDVEGLYASWLADF